MLCLYTHFQHPILYTLNLSLNHLVNVFNVSTIVYVLLKIISIYFFQVDSTEARFSIPIREYMLYNEAIKVSKVYIHIYIPGRECILYGTTSLRLHFV
jgi:hypothetical protein